MSKQSVFDQPGIDQIIPGSELPVGVKVTGRNLSAVTLLASVSGETRNTRTAVAAFFETDGSLARVQISDKDGVHVAQAGDYLVLGDDREHLMVADETEYKQGKEFLNSVSSLDDLIGGLAKILVDSLLS